MLRRRKEEERAADASALTANSLVVGSPRFGEPILGVVRASEAPDTAAFVGHVEAQTSARKLARSFFGSEFWKAFEGEAGKSVAKLAYRLLLAVGSWLLWRWLDHN